MGTVPSVSANMPTRTVRELKIQGNVGILFINLLDVLNA